MSTSSPMDFRCTRHGHVDSTSERAFAALADGSARHGDVHTALAQSAGRGRLGRRWVSAPGEGLYLSVVLLPAAPLLASALTIAAGLAVQETARACGARGVQLKWPNDVLIAGAKLAGILVETRGLDAARPHYVVGIGVNVGQESFPAELEAERPVTSLRRAGAPSSVQEVEAALLARLAPRLDQVLGEGGPGCELQGLERDYVAACGFARRRVRVRVQAGEVEGRFVSLQLEGGLVLATEQGEERFPLEWVRALDLV